MSKFKVGDKVRIRKDLNITVYYGVRIVQDMLPYKGEVATVTYVNSSPVLPDIYELDIDNGHWSWSEDTLEKLDFTKADLKPGYLVKTKQYDLYMVMPSQNGLAFVNESGWLNASDLKENLSDNADEDYDIIEVYGYSKYEYKALEINTATRDVLWKREENKKEMTITEIEKELGYPIKIIKESEEN